MRERACASLYYSACKDFSGSDEEIRIRIELGKKVLKIEKEC